MSRAPLPPAAVLFDCDGVIVDSEGPTFVLLQQDLAKHGLPLDIEELESAFMGGTIEAIATRARAAGADLPPDWVADFYHRLYAVLAHEAPLMPGILDLLDLLDAKSIPYAVGSNGKRAKMDVTLGGHGLLPRFRAVLSAQELGHPKPAPDVYLQAARACGAPPEACVVIEDSPSGARAAQAAEIACWGYAPHGPDTPAARGLRALGVPLFADMAALPGLLGLSS